MKLNQYLKPAQQFEGAFVHTSVGTDAEFDDCYICPKSNNSFNLTMSEYSKEVCFTLSQTPIMAVFI